MFTYTAHTHSDSTIMAMMATAMHTEIATTSHPGSGAASFFSKTKQTNTKSSLFKSPFNKADTTIYYQHNVQTKCPSRRSSILHIIKPQAVYTRLYYVSFITAFYVRTFILYLNWGLDFLTNNWQKTDNSNLTHTNISYISVKNNKSLRGICSSF